MGLLFLSFVAGILTVLAPCVLPLLPVILGGSVIEGKKSHPWRIVLGFAVSALVFTLLVKILFDSFGITKDTLITISARILIIFGIFFLFPGLWQRLMEITGIEKAAHNAQNKSTEGKNALWSDLLLGASLGPVLNSCSPTFALIVYTILPASFLRGLTNIIAYTLGLSSMLLLIAYGGRAVVKKMKRASNPQGWFRKIVAFLIILTGVSILFGWDKVIETKLTQSGYVKSITNWEIDKRLKIE